MLMKPAARGPLLFGAVLLSALLFVACGGGSGDDVLTVSSGALIKNVTIVSTRDGTTRANMAVAVDNGKILTSSPP